MKNRTSGSPVKNPSNQRKLLNLRSTTSAVYPFSAIVAQEEMKLAMILNVIDAKIGGVLAMGHRGTGKSTAVRALGDLLPEISFVSGCSYRCDPADDSGSCEECCEAVDAGTKRTVEKSPVWVVDLPLGATEDRVCGTIDIEQALRSGVKRFEPGLLARANRGFLYIDEVNLLEDHLVDLLLDVSTTGINNVEREGISIRHPARFVLIGSGNPEEGELRPQLLDRFGLYVEVKTEGDLDLRVAIVERREAFEGDPESFRLEFAGNQDQLRRKITRARKSFLNVKVERRLLRNIARLCNELGIDGHRGELTITRAGRALSAFEGRRKVSEDDVRRVAVMALRHRLRRDALDETPGGERIEAALDNVLNNARAASSVGNRNGDDQPTNGGRPPAKPRKVAAPRARARERRSVPQNGESERAIESGPSGTVGADMGLKALPGQMQSSAAHSKLEATNWLRETPKESRSQFLGSNHKGTNRSVYNPERGRHARSVNSAKSSRKIALDATLRAAASAQTKSADPLHPRRQAPDTRHPIPSTALRFKLFKGKQGRLFIFAIDLSGSMALNRINHARDVMFGVLRQSYVHRDSVAIVGFRGLSAEVMLPPSKSILRARRVLESLPMGGGTPLSAGLACSLDLAKRTQPTTDEVVLLVFTDGGANVSLRGEGKGSRAVRQSIIESETARLGAELRKIGVNIVLIDTQRDFRGGDNSKLAHTLGARFQKL